MMKSAITNNKAFTEIFWGHVLPLGPKASFRDRVQRKGATEARFAAEEQVAQMTLDAMCDEREREAVSRGNRIVYGGRLTPGLDLLAPAWPTSEMGQIDQFYDRLNSLYGSEKATAIRLGRDLRRYGRAPDLIRTATRWAAWSEPGATHPAWKKEGEPSEFTVRMQPFPVQHLYRLDRDTTTIWEFDDWPEVWQREWGNR